MLYSRVLSHLGQGPCAQIHLLSERWSSFAGGPMQPRQSVGVLNPNSRGHAKVWESLSPTQGATPKPRSPYPHSIGHAKAWESLTPTQGAIIGGNGHFASLARVVTALSKARDCKKRAFES